MSHHWPLLIATCLLTACAASPTRYYTLMPDDAAAASGPAAQRPSMGVSGRPLPGKGLLLHVLEVPAQNDRLQLVVHDPRQSSPIEVQVLNESLWSAPLADQLQAMLSAQVSAEVGLVDLQALPGVNHQPRHQVDVRVTRFDLVWGEAAQLSAIWTDQPLQGTTRICQARIQVPVDQLGVAHLVSAQSQAVQHLSGLIAYTASGSTLNLQPSSEVTEFGCT